MHMCEEHRGTFSGLGPQYGERGQQVAISSQPARVCFSFRVTFLGMACVNQLLTQFWSNICFNNSLPASQALLAGPALGLALYVPSVLGP